MKKIPLTQGQFATVDDSDFDWLNQWKWYARLEKGTNSFYAIRCDYSNPPSITIAMHRLILNLPVHDPRVGDHINWATLDNRRSNLRIATRAQNTQNSRKPITNTSGYKGVTRHRTGKWQAQIGANGQSKYLGLFSTPELAHAVYCAAALEIHGQYANFGGAL